MSFPFVNRTNLLIYAVVWILFAVLYALATSQLISVAFGFSVIDAFVHALLFAMLGVLLWNVVRYGNYERLPSFQQIINYTALGILTVFVWIGLGYLFDYTILPTDIFPMFSSMLFFRILVGIQLYIVLILIFRNKNQDSPETAIHEDAEPVEQEKTALQKTEDENFPSEILERIVVKIGQKIHVVPITEIIYLQSDGDYVHIITSDGKYLKEQTMKYFESHLPAGLFVRVHRSYIVNVESISRIELYTKQNQLITLKNGDRLKVSASGYKALRSSLGL